MHKQRITDINHFFVCGINYKKTDAAIRGRYAISTQQYELIMADCAAFGISEFFVLSTCNRTEIYGFATGANVLSALLCTQTEGSVDEFEQLSYQKYGAEAITHLFEVAAGLDSQILGDYEIVGQLKLAVKFSKEKGHIGSYLERMVNDVLKAAKCIRTNTALSTGTVSVSFAAIQYLKTFFTSLEGKRILLLGTGKIGTNLCKNLVDYIPEASVTVINRSPEKALALAASLQVQSAPVNEMQHHINETDIILVSTNAASPVILEEDLLHSPASIIIDLSVPFNVDESVKNNPAVTLVNVDELSRIKDETLQRRAADIPKAKEIISTHVNDFLEWHEMRKNVPVLKEMKRKLLSINCDNNFHFHSGTPVPVFCEQAHEERVQKFINGMAVKMRSEPQRGCICIKAMHDFISTASN